MNGLRNRRQAMVRRGVRHANAVMARAALAIAMVIVVFLATASTAAAMTIVSSGGQYPGTATMPKATLDPPNNYIGGGIEPNLGYFTSHARTVNENATYGRYDQKVCVTHHLWEWVPPEIYGGLVITPGHWFTTLSSPQACGVIGAAYSSITDGGYSFPLGVSTDIWSGDKISLDVTITWKLMNGSQLGQKTYFYNSLTDYTCNGCAGGYENGVAYVRVP